MSSSSSRLLRFSTSVVKAHAASTIRRKPRRSWWPRPAAFYKAFEDRILFYDCFRYLDDRVLLIGPAPLNLQSDLAAAIYTAQPSGKVLRASIYPSRSTMLIDLPGVPEDTSAIRIEIGDTVVEANLQSRCMSDFADRRVLFTINKNNRLDWIRTWAQWHADHHGTDAVILVDNGSSDYSVDDLEQTLLSVRGLEAVSVLSMPQKFGPLDHWVLTYHFWPRFLQISMTSLVLRRFGMLAKGIINCDIDELMWANGTSIYDLAEETELGALRVPGQWMEAAYEGDVPADHFGYRHRRKGIKARLSPPKCVLVPTRPWVQDLSVHPYLHRIHGAPNGHRTFTREAKFWHFRGINTNWKEQRTLASAVTADLEIDQAWLEAMSSKPLSDTATGQGQ